MTTKIYLPNTDEIADLIETIEKAYPAVITTRDVIEIQADDKILAAFLQKLADNRQAKSAPADDKEHYCKKCQRLFIPAHHKQTLCGDCKVKTNGHKSAATLTETHTS